MWEKVSLGRGDNAEIPTRSARENHGDWSAHVLLSTVYKNQTNLLSLQNYMINIMESKCNFQRGKWYVGQFCDQLILFLDGLSPLCKTIPDAERVALSRS
jgi:hypothetical protein